MASAGPYRVCFVCSGNICRSPMAEIVLRGLADRAGMGDRVTADSAGTGDWHVGERADRRALSVLRSRGYDGESHRARQFDPDWFASRDLVVALDRGHLRTLRSWTIDGADRDRIRLLRSFDPTVQAETDTAAADVPDPYYDGSAAFAAVLDQVEAACAGLLTLISADRTGLPARR